MNLKTIIATAAFFSTAAIAQNTTTETKETSKTREPTSVLRLQQAVMLGMVIAADTAILDVEWMFPVFDKLTVGPTAFYWFDQESDSTEKIHTLNAGVRADYHFTHGDWYQPGFYASTAAFLGVYSSKNTSTELKYSSTGVHRVGAFMIGYQWCPSEKSTFTLGMGGVKSKIFKFTEKTSITHRGNCPDNTGNVPCSNEFLDSDGRSYPWFDASIGILL